MQCECFREPEQFASWLAEDVQLAPAKIVSFVLIFGPQGIAKQLHPPSWTGRRAGYHIIARRRSISFFRAYFTVL